MKIDWQAIAQLILQLSRVAMEWYKLVDEHNDATKVGKAVAIVLDPDRPEQELSEVVEVA